MNQGNQGILLAVSAYIFWGLHPVYWKLLQNVPSIEIVSHRIFWSLIFFIFIISFHKNWKELRSKLRKNKNKISIYLPAFLIGSNWAMYIWAVNAGYVIETSLGYFISPLVSVLLGVLILKESLRKIQWIAVLITGIGVLIMTFYYGQFPWISIYLAVTWGTYGMLRKKSPLNAVEGLTLETTVLSVPAIAYFIYLSIKGTGSFLSDTPTSLLLIGAGVTSGFPLLLFISGARKVRLSLIGILQYIYPTLIFLLGVFVYNEALSNAKIIGFIFIWIALIVYTIEGTSFLKRKE
jgi:chloramphenicol-sensitive protein RarD